MQRTSGLWFGSTLCAVLCEVCVGVAWLLEELLCSCPGWLETQLGHQLRYVAPW